MIYTIHNDAFIDLIQEQYGREVAIAFMESMSDTLDYNFNECIETANTTLHYLRIPIRMLKIVDQDRDGNFTWKVEDCS